MPTPGNPVPMDIDANRSKGRTPVVCYCCRQPGHIKSDPKCPLKHDVRALDTDELQSILEDRLAQLDVILKDSQNVSQTEVEEKVEDFHANNE
jgi:hypothetical protein